MAINFLNTVDLNQNQLNNAAIQNLGTDPGSGVEGQIYFNTTVDALKIYANGAWVEVGATSGVETFTNVNGTYVSAATVNTNAIGNVTTGIIDLSAVDGAAIASTKFLTKDNKWATVPQGDITSISEGIKIDIDNPGGPIPTIKHELTSRTDTTSTVGAASFPVVNSVTTDSTGHVTAVDIKTVTVPDNNTTYDLTTAPTGTAVRLTDAAGSDDVTISGTTGQTALTRISASELRVKLTDDVTIINDLTVGNDVTLTGGNLDVTGTGSFTGEVTVPTATAGTNAPNLAQVELLIAGVGVFQGGYNASTEPGTPIISGASNVALDLGDYFVVTTAGSLLSQTLEAGDMIFANADIAAGSSPTASAYTFVIADANIAGAGATDGGTQKGVAGFDSDSFTVTSNGWVELKPQSNPYAQKIALTGGIDSGGETTFTVNIVTMFGVGALASNCIATVKETASSLIVYPEVTGNGTGSLDFKFIPVVSTSAGFYTAYISYI